MPGTWPRPSSATSRSSHPSICPSIDPSSTPSFTSSRPLPPIRSTRSSPSSTCSPAISSKQQPEKLLIGVRYDGAILRQPVMESRCHQPELPIAHAAELVLAGAEQRRDLPPLGDRLGGVAA